MYVVRKHVKLITQDGELRMKMSYTANYEIETNIYKNRVSSKSTLFDQMECVVVSHSAILRFKNVHHIV